MTRDDIIRMAKEAWGLEYVSEFDVPKLERFAAIVAEAEREACADIVENADTPDCGGWSTCGIAEAIRARTTP